MVYMYTDVDRRFQHPRYAHSCVLRRDLPDSPVELSLSLHTGGCPGIWGHLWLPWGTIEDVLHPHLLVERVCKLPYLVPKSKTLYTCMKKKCNWFERYVGTSKFPKNSKLHETLHQFERIPVDCTQRRHRGRPTSHHRLSPMFLQYISPLYPPVKSAHPAASGLREYTLDHQLPDTVREIGTFSWRAEQAFHHQISVSPRIKKRGDRAP